MPEGNAEFGTLLDDLQAGVGHAVALDRAMQQLAGFLADTGALGMPGATETAREVRALDPTGLLTLPPARAAALLQCLAAEIARLTAALTTLTQGCGRSGSRDGE